MSVTCHTVLGLSLVGVVVAAAFLPLPAAAVQRMPLMEQFVGVT